MSTLRSLPLAEVERSPLQGSATVTSLLDRLKSGDEAALDKVVPLVYSELHAIACRQLRFERDNHTLNPTALVNEAYLKLIRQRELKADDRGQFLAIATTTMRRLLVDYARPRIRADRGGGVQPIPLENVMPFLTSEDAEEVVALDKALTRLEDIDPRGTAIVQYRFFAGLTIEDTAALMAISVRTARRSWHASRSWLRKEVRVVPFPKDPSVLDTDF